MGVGASWQAADWAALFYVSTLFDQSLIQVLLWRYFVVKSNIYN
jgi:hypothetical protein